MKEVGIEHSYRVACNDRFIATSGGGQEIKLFDWDGELIVELKEVMVKKSFASSEWLSYGRNIYIGKRYLIVLGEQNQIYCIPLEQLEEYKSKKLQEENLIIHEISIKDKADLHDRELYEDLCVVSESTIFLVSQEGRVITSNLNKILAESGKECLPGKNTILTEFSSSPLPDAKKGYKEEIRNITYTAIAADKSIVVTGFLFLVNAKFMSYAGFTIYSAKSLLPLSTLHVDTVPPGIIREDEQSTNTGRESEYTHISRIQILNFKHKNLKLILSCPIQKHLILMAIRDGKTLQLVTTKYITQYSFNGMVVINQKNVLLPAANGTHTVEICFD